MKPKEVIAALTADDTRNFGPDLNILNYVFNPLDEQGFLKQSVDTLNDFNNAV